MTTIRERFTAALRDDIRSAISFIEVREVGPWSPFQPEPRP